MLNHGHAVLFPDILNGDLSGGRLLPTDMEWLVRDSKKELGNFMQKILGLCEVKNQNSYGSLFGRSSHAWRSSDKVQVVFKRRYGEEKANPEEILCIGWKDGKRLDNILRTGDISIKALLKNYDNLKFFMPIRNIIDCAYSNRGHTEPFLGIGEYKKQGTKPSVGIMLKEVVEEIIWFMKWHIDYPDRFHYITETGFDRQGLVGLASFLGIPAGKDWIEDCMECWDIKELYYEHRDRYREFVKGRIEEEFSDRSDILSILMKEAV